MTTDTALLPVRQTTTRLAFAAALLLTTAVPALAAVEDEYTPGGTPAVTTWYGPADPAAVAADRGYRFPVERPDDGWRMTLAPA